MIETGPSAVQPERQVARFAQPYRAVGIEFANVTAHPAIEILSHRESALHRNILEIAKDFRSEQRRCLIETEYDQTLGAERNTPDLRELPSGQPRDLEPVLGWREARIAKHVNGAVCEALRNRVDKGRRKDTVGVCVYDDRAAGIFQSKTAAPRTRGPATLFLLSDSTPL